tara:strand:- start:3703 stop:4746 length:1044 start_codon:yes stop_codon:yes gene_type:complete
MKLGITPLKFGKSIGVDVDLLLHAEALGFDSAWSGEAWGSDAVSAAAWMLAKTEKIKVGTSIMQMPARAPSMTAMTALSLDHMSDGRFICGLGPSGPQVVEGWYGVPYGKPMMRTREYVSILRHIFRREAPLEHQGEHYQIPNTGPGTMGFGKPLKCILHGKPDIPIYTAAISPIGLRLAGEIADGVLPLWMNPEKTHLITDYIKEGQRKGGREGLPFDIAVGVTVLLAKNQDEVEKARIPAKNNLALYIGGMGARGKNFYNDYCKRLGYEEAAVKIQDAYLAGDHKTAIGLVPDELVHELFLIGTEGQLRERMQVWKAASENGGVDTMMIGTKQPRALEILAEELL